MPLQFYSYVTVFWVNFCELGWVWLCRFFTLMNAFSTYMNFMFLSFDKLISYFHIIFFVCRCLRRRHRSHNVCHSNDSNKRAQQNDDNKINCWFKNINKMNFESVDIPQPPCTITNFANIILDIWRVRKRHTNQYRKMEGARQWKNTNQKKKRKKFNVT